MKPTDFIKEDDGGTCSSAIATAPAQNLLAKPVKRVKETKKEVKESEQVDELDKGTVNTISRRYVDAIAKRAADAETGKGNDTVFDKPGRKEKFQKAIGNVFDKKSVGESKVACTLGAMAKAGGADIEVGDKIRTKKMSMIGTVTKIEPNPSWSTDAVYFKVDDGRTMRTPRSNCVKVDQSWGEGCVNEGGADVWDPENDNVGQVRNFGRIAPGSAQSGGNWVTDSPAAKKLFYVVRGGRHMSQGFDTEQEAKNFAFKQTALKKIPREQMSIVQESAVKAIAHYAAKQGDVETFMEAMITYHREMYAETKNDAHLKAIKEMRAARGRQLMEALQLPSNVRRNAGKSYGGSGVKDTYSPKDAPLGDKDTLDCSTARATMNRRIPPNNEFDSFDESQVNELDNGPRGRVQTDKINYDKKHLGHNVDLDANRAAKKDASAQRAQERQAASRDQRMQERREVFIDQWDAMEAIRREGGLGEPDHFTSYKEGFITVDGVKVRAAKCEVMSAVRPEHDLGYDFDDGQDYVENTTRHIVYRDPKNPKRLVVRIA